MTDCFIIMPISTPDSFVSTYSNDKDHFRHVLDFLFKPAMEKVGLTAIPPIAEGADVIHAEIIRNLEQADLVLGDMSTLNPNVFFELGIRTAVDKPVCIVKDDATPRIPFDTTIINYHTYLSSLAPWTLENQISELAAHIQKSLSRSKGQNTLWRYFGLSTRAALPTEKANVDEKLELLSLQIEGLNRRLEQEPVRRVKSKSEDDGGRKLFDGLIQILSNQGIAINAGNWGRSTRHMKISIPPNLLDNDTRSELMAYAESEGFTLEIIEG